jgi:DNA (cytosine-5)-methyltransferase 1
MAVMSFAQNTRDEVRYVNGDGQIAGALGAEASMKQTNYLLCMAHGQSNAEVLNDKSPTLNCNHEVPIICLNNRPQELKAERNISHSLKASDRNEPPVICYENHPGDSRIKELKDGVCSQINARLGTGGCNGPLVMHVAGFLPGQGKKAGDIGYEKDVAPTLRSGCDNYGVLKTYGIAENIISREPKNGGNGIGVQEELQYTLNTSGAPGVCCFVKNDAARDSSKDVAMTLRGQAEHAISYSSTVRRLMPIETERLMGFPDNHTQIEWNGKPKEQCPDGPRYKACGNAMPVNSMSWLGMRIQIIEDYHNGRK